MRIAVVLLAVIGLGAGTALAWVPREHVNLEGPWEVVKVKVLDLPPPKAGWAQAQIPAVVAGYRYECAWFRCRFQAPDQWRGKRVKIVLQGAKYCPAVYINGAKVGEHFGGYEPCQFDITATVKPGQTNEVLIGVHDWTALFKGKPVRFPRRIEWHALRNFPRDRVMYPIGGRFSEFGLWDDVVVYAVPEVYVADAFIRTDVQGRELRVDYELANESDRPVRATLSSRVLDGSKAVVSLGPKTVAIPGGGRTKVTLAAKWEPAKITLWTPERPKLYVLHTRLATAGGTDERRDRMGFRQFTVRGHEFFLNGVRRHLLASSAWPMAARTHDEIAEALKALKSANCIAFRTHTQPWRQIWYDVADEVGLMMIPEGAVWNDDWTYRLDDPEFWRNWRNHLLGMVRALRNHPSVIMWSIENEFFGSRAKAGSVYEKRLADLGRAVKREDPTRPIYYESDGDPDGAADVIGMHYPNEPPGKRLWPDAAYWMDRPAPVGSSRMFWPEPDFLWTKRKPLYIGEYLWWPGGTPASYTLVCGDEAYRDLPRYRRIAKAAVWRWQTIAYRHYEVSGLCPWTLVEGGRLRPEDNPMMAAQAYAMQPLAAYVREETRRAYSGQKVTRHLEIFNDTPRRVRATLRWKLLAANRALAEGGMGLDLEPGAHIDRSITFVAPRVRSRIDGVLRLTIQRDGRVLFSDEHPFAVYERPSLPAISQTVWVYDPAGTTAELLARHGIRTRKLADLESLGARMGGILVVGEAATRAFEGQDPWVLADVGAKVRRFVSAGGRVIVLRQEKYPPGLFPAELDARAKSTMAFIQMPSHSVVADLPEDAFKFWQPNHLVTDGELLRPAMGGYLPLVVTGHPDGISHCGLLVAPRGSGLYIMCQLPVIERFEEEPMASAILSRMLTYAAASEPPRSAVLVAGGDDAYCRALDDIGLRYRRVPGIGESDLKAARTVLIRGAAKGNVGALADWIRGGGTLVLDRPAGEAVAAVGNLAGMRLSAVPYAGPPLRTESSDSLVEAIAREDMYWLGERRPGPGWIDQPLASEVAEGCLSLDVDFTPIRTFSAAEMELSGYIVQRRGDQVVMATVGSATVTFTAPEDGAYVIGVEAMGTPCEGVYAIGAVTVDDALIGLVSTTDKWRRTSLVTTLSRGEHTIVVRFINDRNVPPEDRNFFLRSIAVGKAAEDLPAMIPVAQGPCVAAVRVGRGRVVVNFLRWDTENRNSLRARRFFGSLLTAVGADFVDRLGVSYDLTTFKPMKDIAHYRVAGGYVYMGSSGWIEGSITVPRTGAYAFRLEAAGTKAAGEFPEVVVEIDGKETAKFHLTREGLGTYSFQSKLAAGKHTVRIFFTNDYYKPPEDRNLMLRRLTISHVE